MSFKLLITAIFVSLILAATLLGYRLIYRDPVASDSSATTGAGVVSQGLLNPVGAQPATGEDLEYARLIRVIGTIKTIDRSIFSDPVYLSLVNFRVTIPTPTPGRRNPFAPI